MTERKSDDVKLKITNQFRSKAGFVYDLRCDGARLTVNITQRQGAGDAGEWHVEASTKAAASDAAIAAWADTRVAALQEVGRQWSSRAAELGLPTFDWDAVATALTNVRAV
jgi:hypothetical protein